MEGLLAITGGLQAKLGKIGVPQPELGNEIIKSHAEGGRCPPNCGGPGPP